MTRKAISTDTAQSLKAWSLAQGYTFPLLSDFWPHGAVATAYDVFFDKAGMHVDAGGDLGHCERCRLGHALCGGDNVQEGTQK